MAFKGMELDELPCESKQVKKGARIKLAELWRLVVWRGQGSSRRNWKRRRKTRENALKKSPAESIAAEGFG